MAEEEQQLTTESLDLKGRWIRYVHSDEETGRDRIAWTQIVDIHVTYARPQEHKNLDHADRMYVEWLLEQDGQGQIRQVDIMTRSPLQVMNDEDPIAMVTVEYNALGKPMKIVEFSLATVQEVLIDINKLAAYITARLMESSKPSELSHPVTEPAAVSKWRTRRQIL